MNVIIANEYKDALSNLNIDVIKKMDGVFDVSTITDTFSNFYYNRMIIDITALKDPFNIVNIQKLSASLDASKIILFLSDDPRINNTFLSKIISLGIYNFTRDLSGVSYLMDNPNSYRDVAQYHDLAANDQSSLNSTRVNNPIHVEAKVEPVQYNFVPKVEEATQYAEVNNRVIGFKDLTSDAGTTTLIYMLKKQLKSRKVLAIEINSNDFSYLNDSELMSINEEGFVNTKNKFGQFDIVLIDLNNASSDVFNACDEVIYLLEPSTIKLNYLMRTDRSALDKIKGNKIVLNKSLLTTSDVRQFEYEAGAKIFYNIPPLDERKDTQMVLDSFLHKLGVIGNSGSNSNIFNIFKK